jgi:hypothetical protein
LGLKLRPIAAGSLLALVASCSTVSEPPPRQLPTEPVRDNLIVSFVRIGPAALGMTEAQMLQWLGEPTRTFNLGTAHPGYMYGHGGPDGYQYYVHVENGRASRISTTKRQYETSEGIGVGSAELKARVAFGKPVKQQTHNRCGATCDEDVPFQVDMCFKNGLEISVDVETSKVSQVTISNKGCTIWRN